MTATGNPLVPCLQAGILPVISRAARGRDISGSDRRHCRSNGPPRMGLNRDRHGGRFYQIGGGSQIVASIVVWEIIQNA